MSLVLINVGTIPNDHTGDPFRTAFQKTNSIITALNNGPLTIGPPLASAINLTIDQGTWESNSIPGIFVRGNAGSQAAIAIGADAATPGVDTFDFQQDASGNGYIVTRLAGSGLAFWTGNTPRIIMVGGITTFTAPTENVLAVNILGSQNAGNTHGAMTVTSTTNTRIATFNNTQGSGGFLAIEHSGLDKSFWGDSGVLVAGGATDDYAIRSNAGLDFATGGATRRMNIDSNGQVSISAPTADVTSLNIQGAAGAGTEATLFVNHVSSAGIPIIVQTGVVNKILAMISFAANGGYLVLNRSNADKAFFGDANVLTVGGTIDDYAVRSNAALLLATGGANTRVTVASTGEVTVAGKLGVNNATPPAQVTGFGAPVGAAVINNYNITDAGGANSNTNKCVAEILTVLKNFGLIGA